VTHVGEFVPAKPSISLVRASGMTVAQQVNVESRSSMKKYCLVVAALIFSWFGVAQAQVSVEPDARKDGIFIGEQNRTNFNGKLDNNFSYSKNVDSSISRQGSLDPNRYPERYNQGDKPGINPVYNPYIIHWR